MKDYSSIREKANLHFKFKIYFNVVLFILGAALVMFLLNRIQVRSELNKQREFCEESLSDAVELLDMNRTGEEELTRVYHEENQDMVRVLLSPHGDMNFLHRLNDVLREKCLQFVRRVAPEEGEAQFDYQYSFVVFGTAGLIRAWVNRNCAEPAEQIAQMAGKMIRTGSLA